MAERKVTPAQAWRALIDEIATDDLTDEELARVRDAAAGVRSRIAYERRWRESAHVHDAPHVVEYSAAHDLVRNDLACHDCGAGLVSDAGAVRILVCPRVHGQRPAELVAAGDAAVECGQKERA